MLNPLACDLQMLIDFLKQPTPQQWIDAAINQLPLLLLDHAHCERKAAATAINFISKYPDNEPLVQVISPLAREELLHFEKVLDLMRSRQLYFKPLPPSDYAQQLHKMVVKRDGKERLCDQLLIGAIIEARSCERFNALIPFLQDTSLQKFYASLVKSEARHFKNYLELARNCDVPYIDRLKQFIDKENQLITSEDEVFRFHSGIPIN